MSIAAPDDDSVTGVNEYLSSLFSLDGRIAVITGGSSGIGAAMASALARAGARVVLVARDAGRLASYAADLTADGCTVAWVSADLSRRDAVSQAAAEAVVPFGEPDILVNCAGVNLRPHHGDLTAAEWDLSLEVNLTAPFLLGQRFGPSMAERGWGRIINVTSQQAQRAFGNSGAYGVSKAALAGLTRSQSEAWAPQGVCVNSLCPGWVATPLTAAVAADPVRTAALAERTMAKRNGVPADFEGAAVFLASRASDYITGQTLYADGGFSASLCSCRPRGERVPDRPADPAALRHPPGPVHPDEARALPLAGPRDQHIDRVRPRAGQVMLPDRGRPGHDASRAGVKQGRHRALILRDGASLCHVHGGEQPLPRPVQPKAVVHSLPSQAAVVGLLAGDDVMLGPEDFTQPVPVESRCPSHAHTVSPASDILRPPPRRRSCA
jgi:NAD(P)-dependent dehydrogenase (short-subunit alcohol dehydrogenase family)